MPRVPVYSAPTETPTALPGFRQSSVASPDLFDAGAVRDYQAGQATLAAGKDLLAVATQIEEKDNLQKVQAAQSEFASRVMDYTLDAKANKQGEAANGLTGQFTDWAKKQSQDIGNSLANDAQRQAFNRVAMQAGMAGRHDIATFEIGERNKTQVATFEASTSNLVNLGAVAATPDAAAQFKEQARNGAVAFAASRGYAPGGDQEQALVGKVLTGFHAQRIQQLARTAPDQATAYFEANKGEIDGAQQAEIGKAAADATAYGNGTTAAGDIWDRLGPKKDTDPINLDKMEQEARTQFKDQPEALKSSLASLRDRYSAAQAGRGQRENDLESTVNKAALAGAGLGQIRGMPEFQALPGDKQRAISDYVENKALRGINLANASEARQQQQMARRGMGAYLQYSNVDVLANMSEQQVSNLLPTLGNELTHSLMEKKRALGKSDQKVIEARIDQEDFNQVAQRNGLKPFDSKKSEDEKAQLGQLKFGIEQRIDSEQSRLKRQLTRGEKMQIFQQEMDNKVLVDRTFLPDPSKPAVLLTPDEQKNAYVVTKGGTEVKLSSIPAADRAQIIQARQRQGLTTTEQDVAEYWLRANTKPKTPAGGNPLAPTGTRSSSGTIPGAPQRPSPADIPGQAPR